MPTVKELDARLVALEVIGAERYGTLLKRLDRLEMILIGSAGTLIVGMAGIIVTIVLKGAAS
jgi:hypothetical protein